MRRRNRSPFWLPSAVLLALALPTLSPAEERPVEEFELPGPLIGYPLPLELEPPPPFKADAPSYEEQVAELVNQERWANGQLHPLKLTATLNAATETHSANMASRNFFAHCDLDTGTNATQRAIAAGYGSFVAENIAAGQSTPASVMASWMGSPGHRSNILGANFCELGVGYVLDSTDSGTVRLDLNGDCVAEQTFSALYHYWTQNFGCTAYPVVIEREAPRAETPQVELYVYGLGWAVDMRIRNENGPWTEWMPFSTNVDWTLSSSGGVKTVTVEIRNGFMSVLSHSDTIMFEGTDEIFSDGFESGNVSRWIVP